MHLRGRFCLFNFFGVSVFCLCGALAQADDDSVPVIRQSPPSNPGAPVIRQVPGTRNNAAIKSSKEKVYLPPRLAEVLRLVKSGIEDDVVVAYINKAPYDYR